MASLRNESKFLISELDTDVSRRLFSQGNCVILSSDKIKVLDCTLRDGGYYNNWNFPPETVENYLSAIARANVDVIEIGFRFLPQEHFLGAFAYSTDDYLKSLSLPESMTLSVMVNAKELLAYKDGPQAAVDFLFNACAVSPVDMVRIATYVGILPECEPIAKRLKSLGYEVAVNLMQAGGASAEELAGAGRTISKWDAVDVVYFADSLGNMDSDSVIAATEAIASGWQGAIGIHTHDNKSQALANSIAALGAGASWCDGTVLGMGRGAGNMRTEFFLLELNQLGHTKYNTESIFSLVADDFLKLRDRYGWGPSLPYYLSALYDIHPSYIQEVVETPRFTSHDIMGMLEFLKNTDASSFSSERLHQAISGTTGSGDGAWDASGFAKGQSVLLVAPGSGTQEHLPAICQYVEREKPVVLSLNFNPILLSDLVTAYVASYPTSILKDVESYQNCGKPVILPHASLPENIRNQLDGVEIWDYGLDVDHESFAARARGCTIPTTLTFAYSLAICAGAGAARVFLAGFNGYDSSDRRQEEIIHALDIYSQLEGAPELLSVTMTNLPVKQTSIYSPRL